MEELEDLDAEKDLKFDLSGGKKRPFRSNRNDD
jgi:hypothetical protein